jgi:hypothetical protein
MSTKEFQNALLRSGAVQGTGHFASGIRYDTGPEHVRTDRMLDAMQISIQRVCDCLRINADELIVAIQPKFRVSSQSTRRAISPVQSL